MTFKMTRLEGPSHFTRLGVTKGYTSKVIFIRWPSHFVWTSHIQSQKISFPGIVSMIPAPNIKD